MASRVYVRLWDGYVGTALYVSVKPTSNSITGENNNVAICCVRSAQSSVSYRVSAENYKIEGASLEDILLLIVERNNRYHLPYTNTKILRIIEWSWQFYREIRADAFVFAFFHLTEISGGRERNQQIYKRWNDAEEYEINTRTKNVSSRCISNLATKAWRASDYVRVAG